MKERFNKMSDMNEPDDIMLLSDDEFETAYQVDDSDEIYHLEDEINDLIFQKEELEADNKNIEYILNNEVVDFYRANELFDEIKFNQIEILKIDQKLAQLKLKYDKLSNSNCRK